MADYTVADCDYDSADEGLAMLLGGISPSDITLDAWSRHNITEPETFDSSSRGKFSNQSTQEQGDFIDNIQGLLPLIGSTDFFVRAHAISTNGQIIHPPVQVVESVVSHSMAFFQDAPVDCGIFCNILSNTIY